MILLGSIVWVEFCTNTVKKWTFNDIFETIFVNMNYLGKIRVALGKMTCLRGFIKNKQNFISLTVSEKINLERAKIPTVSKVIFPVK